MLLIAAAVLACCRGRRRWRHLVALAGFFAPRWCPSRRHSGRAGGDGRRRSRRRGGAGRAGTLLPALVVAVWVGGAALLLARELLAHLRLAGARRGWAAADAALRRSCGVRPQRQLHLADVASPRTHGLLVPVIVLPRTLPQGLDRRVLRLIVAHEEAHARWRDPLVHAVVRVVRALLWIAPPLWIAERLVVREREAAADEARCARRERRVCTRYAAALVGFGRLAGSRADPLAVRLGAASDLEYRVRRILGMAPARLTRMAAAIAVLAASVVALGLAPRAHAPGRLVVVEPGGGAIGVRAELLPRATSAAVDAATVESGGERSADAESSRQALRPLGSSREGASSAPAAGTLLPADLPAAAAGARQPRRAAGGAVEVAQPEQAGTPRLAPRNPLSRFPPLRKRSASRQATRCRPAPTFTATPLSRLTATATSPATATATWRSTGSTRTASSATAS